MSISPLNCMYKQVLQGIKHVQLVPNLTFSFLVYLSLFEMLVVVLGFNATLIAKVISWWSVFPGFLTPVLTQCFVPKPPTTFLTCFCRGERRKYARKESRLNWGSNSQPPGRESDILTTEPPVRGLCEMYFF